MTHSNTQTANLTNTITCDVCHKPVISQKGKRGPSKSRHAVCRTLDSRLRAVDYSAAMLTWATDEARATFRGRIMGMVNRHVMSQRVYTLASDAVQADISKGGKRASHKAVNGCCHICGATLVMPAKGRKPSACSKDCKVISQRLDEADRCLDAMTYGDHEAPAAIRTALFSMMNHTLAAAASHVQG